MGWFQSLDLLAVLLESFLDAVFRAPPCEDSYPGPIRSMSESFRLSILLQSLGSALPSQALIRFVLACAPDPKVLAQRILGSASFARWRPQSLIYARQQASVEF